MKVTFYYWTFKRRSRKRQRSFFLPCSFSISLSPKMPPVDRLTYYKSTKRLDHHLKAPFNFLTSFQCHSVRPFLPFFECLSLCCLKSWIISVKALLSWQIQVTFFLVFVHLLHQFCAVTINDTRVEALPIIYRQRRTSDLKSVFLPWNVSRHAVTIPS